MLVPFNPNQNGKERKRSGSDFGVNSDSTEAFLIQGTGWLNPFK